MNRAQLEPDKTKPVNHTTNDQSKNETSDRCMEILLCGQNTPNEVLTIIFNFLVLLEGKEKSLKQRVERKRINLFYDPKPNRFPGSNCPKLEYLALQALLKQGLWNIYTNGVALQEGASKIYQKNAATVLDHAIVNIELPIFLQAVIDGDIPKIKQMLSQNPYLLLAKPCPSLVIESKLTWQRFDVSLENALSIAVKRKQITVIETFLPYIKELDQSKDKSGDQSDFEMAMQVLSQWSKYVMPQNEIVIPEEYAIYAQSLVDPFTRENFPNGDNDILHLSQDAESAIDYLFNKILLPKLIQLDNYLDVELLLLAVYKAYDANFNAFQNWKQRDAFCIRVIGLIQSVLSPETAKIFCESLDTVGTALDRGKAITEISISDLAKALKLKGGESFYRSSRDSHLGLGSEFLCGYFGRCLLWGAVSWAGLVAGKTMSSKNSKFLEHYAAIAATATPAVCNRKS